ncbi:BLUF domain-containing protein [Roseibium algae]|uniref:BLUF domain-containing protein n=1 Tax=Roseibium algae TaxID=3123038 RepID=A0ABU8TJL4_9HYPH
MSDLFYLCYKSTISISSDFESHDDKVSNIVETARRKNSAENVTGCLLFTKDYFFQVLEGTEETVRATFDRIRQDTRHQDIQILSEGELDSRKFPNSWMGFSEHAVSHDTLFSEIGSAIADAGGNLTYADTMVVLSNVATLMAPRGNGQAAAAG